MYLKNKGILILFLLFLLTCSTVSAMESISLGAKYWAPTWTLDGYSNFDSIEWDTKSPMLGPAATFVFSPKFALALSAFTGKFNYGFNNVNYLGKSTDANWDADRTDIDLIPVFLISSYFNMYIGLKYLTYNQTISGEWNSGGLWELEYDLKAVGPGFGLGFRIPFGSTPVSFYTTFTATVLYGDFNISGAYTSENKAIVIYPIGGVEGGVSYSLNVIPLEFVLSYRYQRSRINLNWDDDSSVDWKELDENFSGIILYAGYRFDL